MLFFRSNFFKGSETDLNKLVQKQLALNSTRVTLESSQANNTVPQECVVTRYHYG